MMMRYHIKYLVIIVSIQLQIISKFAYLKEFFFFFLDFASCFPDIIASIMSFSFSCCRLFGCNLTVNTLHSLYFTDAKHYARCTYIRCHKNDTAKFFIFSVKH